MSGLRMALRAFCGVLDGVPCVAGLVGCSVWAGACYSVLFAMLPSRALPGACGALA